MRGGGGRKKGQSLQHKRNSETMSNSYFRHSLQDSYTMF